MYYNMSIVKLDNSLTDDCSIKTMDAEDPLAVARLYYDEIGFRG